MKALDTFAMVNAVEMNTRRTSKSAAAVRILMVDDNSLGLRVRQVVLEELGYSVKAVHCSLEALEHFSSEQYDLVVTDYMMPHLDGIGLIARIRDRQPDVPVILISGFVEALGLNESNTGADLVIQKNSHEVSTLTRGVVRLLSRRVPRKPARAQISVTSRSVASGRR